MVDGKHKPYRVCEICCSTAWRSVEPLWSALDIDWCSPFKWRFWKYTFIVFYCIFPWRYVSCIHWRVGFVQESLMTAPIQVFCFLRRKAFISLRQFCNNFFIWVGGHPYLHSILRLGIWGTFQANMNWLPFPCHQKYILNLPVCERWESGGGVELCSFCFHFCCLSTLRLTETGLSSSDSLVLRLNHNPNQPLLCMKTPELGGNDHKAEVNHEEGANDNKHDKVDPVPEGMSILK